MKTLILMAVMLVSLSSQAQVVNQAGTGVGGTLFAMAAAIIILFFWNRHKDSKVNEEDAE